MNTSDFKTGIKKSIIFATVSIVLISALVFSSLMFFGSRNLAKMSEVPKPPSNYLEIEPENTPAFKWLDEVTKTAPVGSTWEKRGGRALPFKNCLNVANMEPVSALMNYRSFKGEGYTVTALTFAPGFGGVETKRILDILENCDLAVEQQTLDNGVLEVLFDRSFMLSAGDGLIGVYAENNGIRDKALESLKTTFPATLTDTGCLALSYDEGAHTRNLFFEDSYKPLQQTLNLDPTTPIPQLSIPRFSELREENTELWGEQKPEEPYPDKMPEKLPEKVSKPAIPQKPTFNTDDNKAVFEVPDLDGPGCGWKWSGFEVPFFDVEGLENLKNRVVAEKQAEVDAKAEGFLNSYDNWLKSSLLWLPKISAWNEYAQKMDETTGKWQEINLERENALPAWTAYIESLTKLVEKYEKTASEHDKAVSDFEKCLKDAENSGNTGNSRNPSNNRNNTNNGNGGDRNNNVSNSVRNCVKPDKIDVEKEFSGLKPEKPVFSENFKNPNSWAKDELLLERLEKAEKQLSETEQKLEELLKQQENANSGSSSSSGNSRNSSNSRNSGSSNSRSRG